ncbi:MAG: ParB/RepB/Spo0J family partition protein [Cytophagales bacterium]|nr:ParB/RepB/Spo0J family partition protein [Cytophagales bacterium]
MAKKAALGRGLGALLEDSLDTIQEKGFEAGAVSKLYELPLDDIEKNPYQPRSEFNENALQELSLSIKAHGIIQPITVRQLSRNKYQIIAGERRLQASKKAGTKTIPAYIRTADDSQMLLLGLIENIQREDLNAIEIALSYQRLISECDLKQEELGEKVGKDRTTVTNYLRLLKLPPDIQAALRDKKISMGHARAIINIENIDKQLEVYKKIIEEDLSVRKVEILVRESNKENGNGISSTKKSSTSSLSYELEKIQSQLASHFGTKVQLKSDQKNKGEIKIPFLSVDDLSRILKILDL